MFRLTSFLIFLFAGSVSHAQLFNGAISSAIGGTGRAGLESSDGALLNPALVPLLRGFQTNAYYRDGQMDLSRHRQAVGVGAADNTEGVLFPGSLHYFRFRETGLMPSPVNAELWHVAAGWLVMKQVSVGLSVYNLNDTVTGTHHTYSQWNGSLGVLWMIDPHFGVAYVLNNLAQAPSTTPENLKQNLQQGVGFYGAFENVVRLRFDMTRDEKNNPDQKMVYMAGMESLTSQFIIMRLGYKLDDQHGQRFWTAGFGFNGPRLKIDYSFEKNDKRTSGALHSVDMRLGF